MRVIAGELRGRKLLTPEGREVRPTSDKVKGAIFSMLGEDVQDANVLDLFSGTGNLGMEALSRGARHCIFCDNNRNSIRLLRENLSLLKLEDRATVLMGDFRRGMKYDKIDLIFADPPYGRGYCIKVLDAVAEGARLTVGGVLILEHGDGESLPQQITGLSHEKEKRYGRTRIDIYRRVK
jgi:16S rRNA (guanine(966)-N(2))-methyltransferase RsmD